MEIRVYDSNLDLQGIIENQTSLIWTRKYYEPGEFELYIPITEENKRLVKIDNIVYKTGSIEAGVIEYVIMEESSNAAQITVKGRFLSSYLDRRLIKGTYIFNGLVESAMRNLIDNCVPIPKLSLGETQGFDDLVDFQVTYKGLLNTLEKLGKGANIGFRIRPDFNNKTLTFELYKGIDRTSSQGANSRVIFSDAYENLNDSKYTVNTQTEKTIVYVGGEGKGDERIVVSVGSGTGLNLKEMFYNASSERQESLTLEQYEDVLRNRGKEILADNSLIQSFESSTDANVNFTYKVNYDLGDIVTVKKKAWGITQDFRITELQEVYEYGGMKVVPTFGNPLPDYIEWED